MNLHSFNRPGILVLVFTMLLVSVSGALGVVWLRQQISLSAYHCQELEQRVLEFKRKNDFLTAKIAEAHNPDFLKAHLKEQLSVPKHDQVVWADLRVEPFSKNIQDNQPFVLAFNLALSGAKGNSSL